MAGVFDVQDGIFVERTGCEFGSIGDKMKHETVIVPNIYDQIARKEFERREIATTGVINEDQAHLFQIKLRYLVHQNHQPITVYLHTGGGDVNSGLAMYDEIMQARDQGVKIKMVAVGSVMSMGVIILQAASERVSYKNTSFLLHELALVSAGSLGQQKDLHGRALRLQELLNGILKSKSKLTDKTLARLVERHDLYLGAKEALKYGIIDKIL